MREFYLLNGNGVKFDLMSSHGFFHSPDGLGLKNTMSFLRTGDFFKKIDSYGAQKSVSGEMIFRSYEDYKAFADHIAIEPLKLVYKPINTEYRLDCSIATLGKSEIDHGNNRLICPITFSGESKWYFLRNALSAHPGGADAKKYNYDYNYTYYDALTGVLDGINNSPYKAPCVLYIKGYMLNPTWVLSVNNQQIASGKVTAEILDGNQLVINSRDDGLEIAEYTEQNVFVRNLYQEADVARENFLYLPTGDFKITITDDSGADVTAYLEILELYDTV